MIHVSAAAGRKLIAAAKAKRPSKYRAQKTEIDGVIFDSKKEARRWLELCSMARAGHITLLERQVKYPLVIDGAPVIIRSRRVNKDGGERKGRQAMYTADFRYFLVNGNRMVVEDAKGFLTPDAVLRVALVEAIYRIRVDFV